MHNLKQKEKTMNALIEVTFLIFVGIVTVEQYLTVLNKGEQ